MNIYIYIVYHTVVILYRATGEHEELINNINIILLIIKSILSTSVLGES